LSFIWQGGALSGAPARASIIAPASPFDRILIPSSLQASPSQEQGSHPLRGEVLQT